MAKWHGISRRKPTGGRLKHARGKRKTEISSENQFAYLGEEDQRKNYRKTAGSQTVRLLSVHEINVNDPKEGKTVRATINTNYVRRNIVTKGAIVETDIGRVRVTSRPGMHGVVSGVILEN